MQQTVKNFSPVIQTSRLLLKCLSTEQVSEDYAQWLKDPEVIQYLEVRRQPEQTREKICAYVENYNQKQNYILLGIFDASNQKHIGNITINMIDFVNKRCDLALIIGERTYWGKGFASEAIQAVTEFCFETLNLNRVEAGAYASNKASISAFLKSGFIEEARFKNYWEFNGGTDDQIILATYKYQE